MGAHSSDSGLSVGTPSASSETVGTASSLIAPLQELIAKSDPDRLAKCLGLRSAAAAEKLIDQPAALRRLAERMAEGCEGLTEQEAAALCRDLVGERS